jgi:hypothetical protein
MNQFGSHPNHENRFLLNFPDLKPESGKYYKSHRVLQNPNQPGICKFCNKTSGYY